jgi:hypothetical protein
MHMYIYNVGQLLCSCDIYKYKIYTDNGCYSCLSAPRVKVCTRDFCLSGDKDAAKSSWYQAKALCQARGWRLCSREELNILGSSGCCSRVKDVDHCGYDNELVWTDTQGGLQAQDNQGRLNSDAALKNSTEVTLDLGKLQFIQGIQIQGGVADNIFYGAACFSETWYWTFFYSGVAFFLGIFGWRSPRMGVLAGFGGATGFLTIIICARVSIFLTDPAVPGYFSNNPICPTFGVPRTFNALSRLHICLLFCCASWTLVQLIRPERFWLVFVYTMAMMFYFYGAVPLWISFGGMIGFTIFLWMMLKYAKGRAQRHMINDIRKYEERWKEMTGKATESDLEFIGEECKKANATLKAGSDSAASRAGLLMQVLYWIGAISLGRFSRTGKIRQATTSIDNIFAEVCSLSIVYCSRMLGGYMFCD